jgi:hypothetical protein
MAAGWEYQSVYRKHIPGTAYGSADEVLNDEGTDGWELVSVIAIAAVYESHTYEIFYLKRKAPQAIEQ